MYRACHGTQVKYTMVVLMGTIQWTVHGLLRITYTALRGHVRQQRHKNRGLCLKLDTCLYLHFKSNIVYLDIFAFYQTLYGLNTSKFGQTYLTYEILFFCCSFKFSIISFNVRLVGIQ